MRNGCQSLKEASKTKRLFIFSTADFCFIAQLILRCLTLNLVLSRGEDLGPYSYRSDDHINYGISDCSALLSDGWAQYKFAKRIFSGTVLM